MNEVEMRAIIRERVEAIGSICEAARRWGCSPAYLSFCLSGRRAPGPTILAPLGYERRVVVTYHEIPIAGSL